MAKKRGSLKTEKKKGATAVIDVVPEVRSQAEEIKEEPEAPVSPPEKAAAKVTAPVKEKARLPKETEEKVVKVSPERLEKIESDLSMLAGKSELAVNQISSLLSQNQESASKVEKLSKELFAFKKEEEKVGDRLDKLEKLKDEIGGKVSAEIKKVESFSANLEKNLKDDLSSRIHDVLKKYEGNLEKISSQSKTITEKLEPLLRESKNIGNKIMVLEKEVSNLYQIQESADRRTALLIEEAERKIETVANEAAQVFSKVEEVLNSASGAIAKTGEAHDKVDEINRRINETSENFEKLTIKIHEAVLQSEMNHDRINLTLRLVDEVEEKVQKLIAPVDEALAEDIDAIPETSELGYDLNDLLQVMVKHQASDLHLKVGAPPTVRLEGELIPIGNQSLTERDCKRLILSALTKQLRRKLFEKKEVDLAYSSGAGRFRINAFLQKGTVSAAFRLLRLKMPTIEELGLPQVVKKFAQQNHGLILVTGPASSGKTTTLASIIDYINNHRKAHIITIEDPIEFLHEDKLGIVTQRELGNDVSSYTDGLRQALRQDPNVIFIGEMRDAETIMTAVIAAETGHLVLSTMHTPNTIQAIDRIVDVFPGEYQRQFRLLLANTLRGVISQRLLQRADETGMVPAVEALVVTPTISSLILEGKTNEIYQYMVQGAIEGMQTFTTSLTKLYEAGKITKEEALYHSDQPTEFRLGVEGHSTGGTTLPEDSLMSWL
ncbi:MAG: PilT/PilU family type 4a pilus ATPase [Firmicutes bacterium]|nr:PilT/PilU family type 4a pilus ATPase [Bacillota bacterium]